MNRFVWQSRPRQFPTLRKPPLRRVKPPKRKNRTSPIPMHASATNPITHSWHIVLNSGGAAVVVEVPVGQEAPVAPAVVEIAGIAAGIAHRQDQTSRVRVA